MVIFHFDEWVCKSVPPKLPVFMSAAAPGYFERLPAQEQLVELFDRQFHLRRPPYFLIFCNNRYQLTGG